MNLIFTGIKKLKEDFKGKLQIQIMFMPQNKDHIGDLAKLLNEIAPNEVALNTPTRPYPSGFDIITRGAHGDDAKKNKYSTKPLKQLTVEEAENIEKRLKELTGLNFISVYN